MSSSPTKTQESKTENTFEDKRRNQEVVRCRIPESYEVPEMGTQYSPDPQKEW